MRRMSSSFQPLAKGCRGPHTTRKQIFYGVTSIVSLNGPSVLRSSQPLRWRDQFARGPILIYRKALPERGQLHCNVLVSVSYLALSTHWITIKFCLKTAFSNTSGFGTGTVSAIIDGFFRRQG